MNPIKKSLLTVLAFSVVLTAAQAQVNNRTNAFLSYKSFTSSLQKGETEAAKKHLLSAKEYIDKAAAHADTERDARTLYYKGEIYTSLAVFALDPEMKSYASEENIRAGLDAYKASIANKTKKDDYTREITQKVSMLNYQSATVATEMYNKKEYKTAFEGFVTAYEVLTVLNQLDTSSAFNAGLCADILKDYDNAEKYFRICLDAGYRGAPMHVTYINVLLDAERHEDALKAIREARSKYPKDRDLIITELSYYLQKGDNEASEKVLQEAVEADPNNPLLYFSAGVVYDNLKKYEEAIKAYEKAISLNPEYFDAYFNLGAVYHNEAADMYNKLNDITDNKEYEKGRVVADARIKEALPYLEKARSLNPDDRDNLIMLRNVYGRLNETDKWNEVNELLK